MRYGLFLSDFDGTLVRADGTISEKNIRAIGAYRAAGGVFAVVTGRMLSSILPRLKELGLKEGTVVAYQGAMIADIATGRLIKNDGFSPEQAARAVEFLLGEGRHTHVYLGDRLYCNVDDEYFRAYERICGVSGTVEPDLAGLVRRRGEPVTKVLAMIEPEERDPLIARLCRALGDGYTVTASDAFMAEILPGGVDKARAVEFLGRRYGIPRERTAAIGDQLNDLPMLMAAGGKFAVSNAARELKQIATVFPSCEEDGVAAAIEYAMGENE